MKKTLLFLILVFMIVSIIDLLSNTAISNPTGAPAGNTGSPSDGTTCAESCHGGAAVSQAGIITSNVPVGGYVPGTTYTISISVAGSGNKGFQVSPQNTNGVLIGTLIAGSGNKIVSSKYVTHSSAKTTNPATWSFQWTAPVVGAGAVTFYGAFAITQAATLKSTLVLNQAVAAPIISSFNPTSAATGATVTITGSNFSNATSVKFGNVLASSFVVLNANTITAVVSGTSASGNISISTAGGTANLAGFIFLPAPILSSFSPQSAGANQKVTLTGNNFTGTTAVKFGDVAASSFSVISNTSIEAFVGNAVSGNVEISTPGGLTTLTGFTFISAPQITLFSPTTAIANQTVTITGTNFTGATAVSFGGTAASSFAIVNATAITAVVGNGTSGAIEIVTAGGTTNLAGFTFLKVPTVNSFSPSTAKENDTITINGTDFNSISSVTFEGIPAKSFQTISSSQIKAVVGNGASGGITVTNLAGNYTLAGFTFLSAPTITSFLPLSARAGQQITIVGNHFLGTSKVSFGGVDASSFVIINDDSIQAIVGAGLSGDVLVTTLAGTAILNGFQFIPSPNLISFAPNAARNGDTIQIVGNNLAAITAVNFGKVACKSFKLISSTLLEAVVDTGESGAIQVIAATDTLTIQGFTFINAPLFFEQAKRPSSKLILFPNPCVNYISIQDINTELSFSIKIIDAQGKLIEEINYSMENSNINIDTRNLSSGLYQLILSDNKQMRIGTFVKPN